MKLHCNIQLPASKSESNRALMIAAYGGFAPDFKNLSDSNDTKVLMNVLDSLPFIDSFRHPVPHEKCFAFGVANDKKGQPQVIDIADCGTAARFMTTYLACHEGTWFLTGTERMRQRPMAPLVEALKGLGADIQYVEIEGFLPLQLIGQPLEGGKVSIDMAQSSQFASSLLLAAPMFPQGLELELRGEHNSLPYLDMTINMMCQFSAQVGRKGNVVRVKPKPYQPANFKVSGDWSAASYWYEMAAFSEECEIKLRFLNLSKGRPGLQGDAIIAVWMQQLGVGTFVEDDVVVLRKISFEKHPLSFDFSQHPDLYPTMAAICAGLHIEAQFSGLDNLALKESNRVEAMQKELAKLGNRPVHFCTHNDHRIAMALAPLSMLVGPVIFDHQEVVKKSYPGFWNDASFLPVKR